MIRKLSAVLVAAACAAGGFAVGASSLAEAEPGAAAGPAAAPSVDHAALPREGSYSGVDHAGRIVTFTFSGNYMNHFTVAHKVIGGAHVGSNAWHETCHGGYCTKGMWLTDTHVNGSWRLPDGQWTHFSAYHQPALQVRPYAGPYMGRDHTGLAVHLEFRNGMIHGFKLDHSVRGNVSVDGHGRFETCLPSICVKGHWQSEYEVVGSWRPVNGSHWVQWEAYAYAA